MIDQPVIIQTVPCYNKNYVMVQYSFEGRVFWRTHRKGEVVT
jgi:hypothetical protein